AALARLGQALTAGTSPADLVCRTGGDEFTLLMPGRTLPEAVQLVERLRNGAVDLTASAGVLSIPAPEPGLRDRYLRALVELVAEAKQAGRDRLIAASWPLQASRDRPPQA